MGQRYLDTRSHDRMSHGLCPECGEKPEEHDSERRFWLRDPNSPCILRPDGVNDRINQYKLDQANA